MAKRSASSPKTNQAGQSLAAAGAQQLAQSVVAPEVTILLPPSADPPWVLGALA